MLYINGLVKKAGREVILDNISFQVGQGEMFTLVGPMGAGKTTILKIITGFINADAGEVYMDGVDCLSQKKQARALYGYVPDNLIMYEKMTLMEYMEMFAALNEMTDEDSVYLRRNLLEFVGLGLMEKCYTEILNRCEKLKLSIARAILHNPKVIILDNPFRGLELEQVYEIRAILEYLRSTGRTIIMTSDNVQLAAGISTSIGIIDEGKMLSGEKIGMVYDKIMEMTAMEKEKRSMMIQGPVDEE